MRLVQIQLKPSIPFWFVDDTIRLSQDNPTSDYVNVDALPSEVHDIIDLSIRRFEINVFDCNGVRIRSLGDATYISGDMAVSVDDVIEDDKDLMPEIVSVTVEDLKEEKEENLQPKPSEEHLENAKILLEQNGNTVKKTIKNMSETKDNLILLYACLQIEVENKARKGIVSTIEDMIERYSK